MRSVTRTVVITLLITYLVTYLGLLFISMFQFPTSTVLSRYFWPWVASNAVIQFFDALIPIQCAGLLLAYSLFVKELNLGGGPSRPRNFSRIVQSTVLLLLVLTLGYAFAEEVLLPREAVAHQQMTYDTSLASSLLSRAQAAFKGGHFSESLALTGEYLSINPGDAEALSLQKDATDNVPNEQSETGRSSGASATASDVAAASATSTPRSQDLSHMTVPALLQQATGYYQSGDYFSAYYYASLALKLDPARAEARRLMSQATGQIQSTDLSTMAKEKADLYKKKQAGFSALENDGPIQAYYIFSELMNVVPNDPDVQRYFPQALSQVQQVAFFRQEAENAIALPSMGTLNFVNRRTDSFRDLVHFGKLVESPDGIFAFDVEVIRTTPNGDVTLHFSVPYAKFSGQYLLMHAIGRSDPGISVFPTVYVGALPKTTGPIYQIFVPVNRLPALAVSGTQRDALGFFQLWSSVAELESFGHAVLPVYQEILMRLLLPFSFMSLSLFSISLGWRFRSRYLTRPPIPALLLTPAILGVAYYLYRAYLFGFRAILGFSVLQGGLTVGIVVMLVAQGILLAAALLVLAAQATE